MHRLRPEVSHTPLSKPNGRFFQNLYLRPTATRSAESSALPRSKTAAGGVPALQCEVPPFWAALAMQKWRILEKQVRVTEIKAYLLRIFVRGASTDKNTVAVGN